MFYLRTCVDIVEMLLLLPLNDCERKANGQGGWWIHCCVPVREYVHLLLLYFNAHELDWILQLFRFARSGSSTRTEWAAASATATRNIGPLLSHHYKLVFIKTWKKRLEVEDNVRSSSYLIFLNLSLRCAVSEAVTIHMTLLLVRFLVESNRNKLSKLS